MTDVPQTISALLAYDRDNLERARDWVKGHFTELADEKYAPIDGKLRVLDAILASGWIESRETQKFHSLGVAFGDAIAQKLLMEWIVVEDEFGRSAALNWPGTTLVCSPITMISKRVEDGEDVDIYELFEGICERLQEMAFSGRFV
jgi:hypothetical protein